MKILPVLLLSALLGGCGTLEAFARSWTEIRAEGYTAEEILLYFEEIAFSSEYGEYRGTICKWSHEIVYSVDGVYTEAELAILEDLSARLNKISGFPGIRRTENIDEANFPVHFVTQEELVDLFGEEAVHSSGMSRFYWQKLNGEIVRAEAGILSSITPQSAKSSVICEEFLQALGLASDSYTYPESVFYEGYSDVLHPAEIDWALLELLYNDAIRCGDNQTDAITKAKIILGIGPESTDREENDT